MTAAPIGEGRVRLAAFAGLVAGGGPVRLSPAARERMSAALAIVEARAAGPDPVYGMNTGLGAKLAERIPAEDIPAFQRRFVLGRAVAAGAPLPEATGRAVAIARLVSAANGPAALSLPVADHLCALLEAGLSPVVPEFGSIGAADLTQLAVWALGVLGEGEVWRAGEILPAARAFAEAGIAAPPLGPRDGLALASHAGLSVALAADALGRARTALDAAKAALLLSYAGYDANRAILAPEVNALRPAPGQAEAATWLRERLAGTAHAPRRIQEALSFRQAAPVTGAAEDALARAVAVWEDEANGTPDSPVALSDGSMASTPNFHAPALALALEGVSLAMAMAGQGAVQRMQRMMSPALSGLPRDLSPEGGAAAGMVPLQKTAAALLAEIRRHAQPAILDPAPVSEGVEDMACLTPLAARKLCDQMRAFRLLAGAEALVAAQAIDLRGGGLGAPVARLHAALRDRIPPLGADRPLGADIETAARTLDAAAGEI